MELTFLYSARFVRDWDRHRLTDSDLQALEVAIGKAPTAPPVMKGTGGMRKIRFAPPSRRVGKSGAMRVGFAYFQVKAAIFVVAILSKNEASNFTSAQRAMIARELKDAERNFK
jgi:hypothetical protein